MDENRTLVRQGDVTRYSGLCEASAAVFLDRQHFAVASDETNVLRIYRRGATGTGREVLLEIGGAQKSDLEAAARIGRRVYWISSHSLPKGKVGQRISAKEEAKRRCLFLATEIVAEAGGVTLKQVGYRTDLAAAFLQAAGPDVDPAELNIEGMAATPEGGLLIGLRTTMAGQAVILHLKNPKAVAKGRKPAFGSQVRLDLGGSGIRSLEDVGADYLLIAGPQEDAGSFALYLWPGPGFAAVALPDANLDGLRPEAVMLVPDAFLLQVLCDDGGKACSDVTTPLEQRAFRSVDMRL